MSRSYLTIVAFAVALVLCLSSLTLADHRAEAEEARRRLEHAEARLGSIAHEHAAAQSALNDAINRQAHAANAAAAAQQQAEASAAAAAEAQARIAAVGEAARNLGQEIAQKRADFEQAKPLADTLAAEIEAYRARKIAAFEASPQFRQITDEMVALQQQHDAELEAAIDWVQSTDVYAELYAEMEEAEAVVRARRAAQPLDEASLAAASQEWIETKNALQALVDEALAADPLLLAANQRLEAVEAQHKALVAQFNKELAGDDELNRMIAALEAQQATLKAMANEINQLEQQRAAADADYARLSSIIADETARMEQAQRDAASLAFTANALGFEVSRYQSDVARLCDAELVAGRERDRAAGHLRHVIELADAERVREEIARGHDRPRHSGGGFVHGGYGERGRSGYIDRGAGGGGFIRAGSGGFVHDGGGRGGGFVHDGASGGGHFSGPGHDDRADDTRRDHRHDRERDRETIRGDDRDHPQHNDRRQQDLLASDQAERERVVREAGARRAEDARLGAMSAHDAGRAREQMRQEAIRRAEEAQRAGLIREREERRRRELTAQSPVQPGAAQPAPARSRPPQPVDHAATEQADRAEAVRRAAEQRQPDAGAEQADRAEAVRRAAEQRQPDAVSRQNEGRESQARADREQREAHDRARESREAQARAESARRESERRQAQAKADYDRREAQTKAESDRRDSESRQAEARAENDRKENERRAAQARAESQRRESERRESQSRGESDRRDRERREAQAKADSDRRRTESDRRESERRESDRRRGDDRKQAEQRDRERDKNFRK